MSRLVFQKELVRHKIETERKLLGSRVRQLGRTAGPSAAAASLGRIAGARLGLLAPAVTLLGKGPRLATWLRIAAVAYLAAPLMSFWFSRARRSRAATSEPPEAV